VPSTVYTSTFLRFNVTAAYYQWVCPIGKRAVVTSIVAAHSGATVANVDAWIEGVACYRVAFQAARGTDAKAVRMVIYGGEELLAYITGTGISLVISGYLFDDAGGAAGPAGGAVRDTRPEPLPSIEGSGS
jgi:hypothetical protein